MLRKVILYDILMTSLLLTGCLALGLIVNESRKPPLLLTYLSPEARLNTVVANLGASISSEVTLGADVEVTEMRSISRNHSTLILDARPQTIFKLGHIPSALSLPRGDFKKSYQSLQKTLASYWNKTIVVYCSERECPDSRLVGEALRRLGYQDVRLFRGGWDEWIDNDRVDDEQADGEQVNAAQVDGEPVYAKLPIPEGCGCGH